MAMSGALTATLISAVRGERSIKSIQRFWYAALTCAAASPIGYASLQYINYPMMVLAKTMKPVPVLLVGVIGYGNRYPWYQYVTVLCLSGGLALYTFASDKGDKGHSKTEASIPAAEIMATAAFTTLSVAIPGVVTLTLEILKAVWGIILVCVNLTLDGYTNNEQDKIFAEENISGIQMMKYTNIWQVVFISIYLFGGWVCFKSNSELSEALLTLLSCPEIQRDIGLFCICASLGQILVFQIMEEHGSLVWITISITRKLFTILVSVIAFHHPLNFHQCIGIAFVFAGITLELIYKSKKAKIA
jgi:UDP-galactose transporter B1